MRRTRQRDDRRAHRVSRARGPAHGAEPHGAHHSHCQYLEHAGLSARGKHLHGCDPRRVLPRPGLRRCGYGRLDFPLGGGASRALRAHGGNAGGGGLPRLPADAHCGVLRARRELRVTCRGAGLGVHHRCGEPAGRRLLRAGYPAHQALRARVLGPRPPARQRATLSRHLLARQLQRVRR